MDSRLLRKAQTQGDVFSARDVNELGVTKAELDRCLRDGAVVRLLTGGFALPLAEPDPWGLARHLQLVRVALRLEPTAAAAHVSALVAHRVELFGPELQQAHLSRAGRRATSHRPSLIRHSMPASAQLRTPRGIRALDPASALIQYAKDADFEQALCALDSALHQDLLFPEDITQRLDALPRNAGTARWRNLLAAADSHAESVGETRTRLLLVAQGHRPFSQVPVCERGGQPFAQLDFQLVGTRVAVEFDGHGKYGAVGALVAEKRREDRIRAVGYLPVRLEWSDLYTPASFLRRLDDALRADAGASSFSRIGPCRYPTRNRVRAPHVCQGPHDD